MRISDWSSDVCSADLTDPQNALKPMLELGMAAPGTVPPLAARIPAPARPALKALIARSPVPPAEPHPFETRAAALILICPTVFGPGLCSATETARTLITPATHSAIPDPQHGRQGKG